MTCAAHALLAGAIGALARRRSRAFLAGVGSHLLADLVPHRDFAPALELLLVAAALAAVGGAAGFTSPAFAGAVGGVAPDAENGFVAAGATGRLCFPTHRGVHGRARREVWPQVLLSAAAFALILQRSARDHPARQEREECAR